ncbi:MAG TPA: hypothetical protein PLR99_08645 [Polyangiaceae bacterium]|nr:hypothetical protein [Polyangiaceae bacterium]
MKPSTLEVVRAILSAHTSDPRLVDGDPRFVSLQSLAIPSVDMIGIVLDLEDRFGRPIDQARLHDLVTLHDLVVALEEP